MEERQLLFEQLSEQRRATQQETTDRITALQASEPLREALRNLQDERDSLQRRFLRQGKRLMELQRTLQVNGLGQLAEAALQRADVRHARLNKPVSSPGASAMAPLTEEEEVVVSGEGGSQQRAASGDGSDVEKLAESINRSSFVSARQRAESMSSMSAANRRRLSSVSGLQQARRNAVARGPRSPLEASAEPRPGGHGATLNPAGASAAQGAPRRLSFVQHSATGGASAAGSGQTAGTPPPKPPLPAHVRWTGGVAGEGGRERSKEREREKNVCFTDQCSC